MKNWKVWLHGLGAAAVGAAATALMHVTTANAGAQIPWPAIGVAALVGAAGYLIKSPLPGAPEPEK